MHGQAMLGLHRLEPGETVTVTIRFCEPFADTPGRRYWAAIRASGVVLDVHNVELLPWEELTQDIRSRVEKVALELGHSGKGEEYCGFGPGI